jgi:hypothetical protein
MGSASRRPRVPVPDPFAQLSAGGDERPLAQTATLVQYQRVSDNLKNLKRSLVAIRHATDSPTKAAYLEALSQQLGRVDVSRKTIDAIAWAIDDPQWRVDLLNISAFLEAQIADVRGELAQKPSSP